MMTVREITEQLRSGACSAVACCAAALDRVARVDPQVQAFTQVTGERALERAAAIDADRAAGRPVGPLAGVPIAVKDNLCTAFGRTTCASRMLENYCSPFTATAVERLEAAGAVIIGKTNLDEFAMGSSTENSALHPTRNPWDLKRVPGGSSGGSAAAVASGMVVAALGSDTGGSIRLPAAFCGVVGLKPTYGRVSRYGLVAFGSSLDQIGPLTNSVEDAALLLKVIAGKDPRDTTSVDKPVPDFPADLTEARLGRRRLRIGVPREYLEQQGLEPESRLLVERALEVYKSLGATLVDVSLPRTAYAIPAYYLVATAEASSNLARYDGVHYGHRAAHPEHIIDLYTASRSEGFGPEVKRRIMLGTFALSAGYYDAYYNKALQIRRLIKDDFDAALRECDVLAGPVSPTPAFRSGEKLADPLAMYLADVYTVSLNLAGLPGLCLPCGFSSAGLPVGLQLTGPVFGESVILQAARIYERATEWHTRRAPLAC